MSEEKTNEKTNEKPNIVQRIDLTDEDVHQPMFVNPIYWPWKNLKRGESIVVVAPASVVNHAIKAACNHPRTTITYKRSFKIRDDGREAVLLTCVQKVDRYVRVSERLEGRGSPNGKPLDVIVRMRFTAQDAMEKTRHTWPWKELRPGEAAIISGPRSFMNQVSVTAAGYTHPACDRKIRSKRGPVNPDGHREVIVWCEAIE